MARTFTAAAHGFRTIPGLLLRALGAALLTNAPGTALAGALNANIAVSATVIQACTRVTATALNFGNHASGGAAIDARADVSVICNKGTPYTLRLDAGAAPGAGENRHMTTNGSYPPGYSLHRDPERSQLWDGTATHVGTQTTQSHAIYGQILPRQELPAGPYLDAITVTVSF